MLIENFQELSLVLFKESIDLSILTRRGRDGTNVANVRQALAPGFLVFVTLTVIIAAGFSQPVYADSYMDSLQSEANKLEVLGKAMGERDKLQRRIKRKAAAKKVRAGPRTRAVHRKPAKGSLSAERKAFENELLEQFPGSFALYTLLKPAEKDFIVQKFHQSKEPGLGRFLSVLTIIVDLSIKSG